MLRNLSLRTLPLFRFSRKKKKGNKRRKKVQRIRDIFTKEVNVYDPLTAFRLTKAHSIMPYDESIDIFIKLGTNPKRSEFNMRGSCYMPTGMGKKEQICFVAFDENEEKQAREAGIDLFCDDKMLDLIGKGVFQFDKLYATEHGVKNLKAYARILGPKGLFPNKKVNIYNSFLNSFRSKL